MPTLTSRNSATHVTKDMVIKAVERTKYLLLACTREEAMALIAGVMLTLDVEDFSIDAEGGIFSSPVLTVKIILNKGDPELTLVIK